MILNPPSAQIVFGSIGYGAQIFDPHLSIFLRPHKIYIGPEARIDGLVKVEGGEGVWIGQGVHVSSLAHLNIGGGRLLVGAFVALTSGVAILSGTNTMAGQAMSSAARQEMQVVERGGTMIDDFAFIGCKAIVYPGVHIGRYAVVKAGSIVTKDVPDFAIVAGIPAIVIGDRRDREGWDYA